MAQVKQEKQEIQREMAELVHDKEKAEDRVLCAVCMECERDTVLLPCAHLAVCSTCATVRDCPICRSAVHKRLTVKLS